MSTARALTARMDATGRTRTKDGILAIVSDDHNAHCLTEEMLDAWWASLPPTHKAEIYEADLEGLLTASESQPSPVLDAVKASAEAFVCQMLLAKATEVHQSMVQIAGAR